MAADMNSLVPAILRVTVFLLVAGLLSLALRRGTAAVRHLVWTAALAGALAIPFLSGVLPRWTIPVWADLVPAQGVALFRVDAATQAPNRAPNVGEGLRTGTQPLGQTTSPAAAPDWGPAILVIWCIGALAVLLQTLLGAVAVMRLKKRAAPSRPDVVALAGELSREMGLREETQVLTTEDATTPMTWGVFRPVILLPAVLVGDPARLRAVLLHELAHVARRDYVLHLLAQAACALYWFHPLVWLARREALRMRERASDDLVLHFGVRPADYALSLVQLSRSLAAPRLCAGLGIARCSNLEKRVRAILDPGLRRGRLTPAWALLAVVAAGSFAIALGVVQPALAEIPPLPLLAPMRAALPVFALASSPAPATQPAIPGSDLATIEVQAAAAAKAYDFEQALSLYLKAAEMTKVSTSVNSPQYAAALMRIGALCRAWDRWEPAHLYYSQALSSLERVFGPNYPGLAEPLYFLAMEAEINKDLTRAESLYQRVLDLHQSPPGRETSLARMGKARVLRGLGRDDEADLTDTSAKATADQRSSLERAKQRLEESQRALVAESRDHVRGVNEPASELPPYRVGNGVTAPVLTFKVEPGYSQEARTMKFQGTATLRIVVGVDGVPESISVVRQLGVGLDEKAVEAVRQWRFNPGTKDGVPVRVSAQVEVNFRLL